MELEANNQLPFLDLMIKRSENMLSTRIYRKPTHTQLYINWRSNHPKNVLIGTLKSLIHRAHKLTDEKDDLLDEIQLLKDVFLSNGYPMNLVEKTIKESWNVELIKSLQQSEEKEDKTSEFYEVIHAPYIQGFSEVIQRELRKANIGFVPDVRLRLQSLTCRPKQEEPKERMKDVVYGIQCLTCNLWYIGETSQRFETRKRQHQSDVRRGIASNALYCHLRSFPDHNIGWSNTTFLDFEQFWDRRKIKESIIINALNPAESITNLLNIDKGRNIDNCWKEFKQDIYDSLSSKLKPSTDP
jgi:uncharacterized protein (UPF0335 family)